MAYVVLVSPAILSATGMPLGAVFLSGLLFLALTAAGMHQTILRAIPQELYAAVAALLALVRLIRRGHTSSVLVLTWGGLRGGLCIALALSVPEALGHTWMVGATYVVVVFSIVLQGGSMDRILRWRNRRTLTA
jgi:NhaP-type Na+/H+ or K+/H+ antiporter